MNKDRGIPVYNQGIPSPVGNSWSPSNKNPYNEAHVNSDTDITSASIHHTLGVNPNQAAAGNRGFLTGDIKLMSDESIPKGWLSCNGEEYSIIKYERLFYLMGYTFGGTVGSTFVIPFIPAPESVNNVIALTREDALAYNSVYSDSFNSARGTSLSIAKALSKTLDSLINPVYYPAVPPDDPILDTTIFEDTLGDLQTLIIALESATGELPDPIIDDPNDPNSSFYTRYIIKF